MTASIITREMQRKADTFADQFCIWASDQVPSSIPHLSFIRPLSILYNICVIKRILQKKMKKPSFIPIPFSQHYPSIPSAHYLPPFYCPQPQHLIIIIKKLPSLISLLLFSTFSPNNKSFPFYFDFLFFFLILF